MKTIDVVAAIIERSDRILLAQRDSSRDQAGLWEFPGGKLEQGETQQQALNRELNEELAIDAVIGRYIASSQWPLEGRVIHLHAWLVIDFHGVPQPRCHSALKWLSPIEASRLALAPADVPLLAAYLQQRNA